jgi:hypothetical protein
LNQYGPSTKNPIIESLTFRNRFSLLFIPSQGGHKITAVADSVYQGCDTHCRTPD